jgi:hypothetical protein
MSAAIPILISSLLARQAALTPQPAQGGGQREERSLEKTQIYARDNQAEPKPIVRREEN